MTFKLNSLENIVGNGIQAFSTMVPLVDEDNSLRLSRTKRLMQISLISMNLPLCRLVNS